MAVGVAAALIFVTGFFVAREVPHSQFKQPVYRALCGAPRSWMDSAT